MTTAFLTPLIFVPTPLMHDGEAGKLPIASSREYLFHLCLT